jgi:hypothetical protein
MTVPGAFNKLTAYGLRVPSTLRFQHKPFQTFHREFRVKQGWFHFGTHAMSVPESFAWTSSRASARTLYGYQLDKTVKYWQ